MIFMKTRLYYWFWFYLPPIAYMVAIFSVSAMPNPTFQGETPDYVLHALEYFLLSLLLIRALLARRLPENDQAAWMRLCLLGAALAICYGACDEWHQYFVPNRHCSLHDVAADAFGALLACGAGWLDYFLKLPRRAALNRVPISLKLLSYSAYQHQLFR